MSQAARTGISSHDTLSKKCEFLQSKLQEAERKNDKKGYQVILDDSNSVKSKKLEEDLKKVMKAQVGSVQLQLQESERRV
jgi:hypothetical protein